MQHFEITKIKYCPNCGIELEETGFEEFGCWSCGGRLSNRLEKLVSVPFSDEQLEVISKAIESFLVDTVIVDENGKVNNEITITLRNDAQGIRYYLQLTGLRK